MVERRQGQTLESQRLSDRLTNASAQDFQQALEMYAELSSPCAIRDVGRTLALNLWRAGMDTSPVVKRILQTIHRGQERVFHDVAEFYRDTGDFGQMERMLAASRREPGFFEDFWLASARKKHEFGQNPQPDLDKVRTRIEAADEHYSRGRWYSALAEATYDITDQSQTELLGLAREHALQIVTRNHEVSRQTGIISASEEPEHWQALLIRHLPWAAEAFGHCRDYKGAMELYGMLNPNVDIRDKRNKADIIDTQADILYSLMQSAFKHGDYSEGFNFADQWFDRHKKELGAKADSLAAFLTDDHTVLARMALAKALHNEGRPTHSRVAMAYASRGILGYEGGISARLFLLNKYQETRQEVGWPPDPSLYVLALREVDAKPSNLLIEPVKEPSDVANPEWERQLRLRQRVDEYLGIARGYAEIGRFGAAKRALARVDQFGDADDEIKEGKVETLSYIAYQEKAHADKFAA